MARVFARSDQKRLDLPGRVSRQVVSGASGAQNVTVRIVEIEPDNGSVPQRGPHVHLGFEECIYVLSGSGITEAESGSHAVNNGDCVLIPPGELHVTRNTGTERLVLLCFFPVAEVAPGTEEFASWELARRVS